MQIEEGRAQFMLNNSARENVVSATRAQSAQPSRMIWFIALLAAAIPLLIGASLSLTSSSGIQNYAVRDNFFWLNSGWRILHGQIPHTDFSLATGTLVSYLTALGISIRGPFSGSIMFGQAVFALVIAALTFIVLRRRTTPLLTVLGTLLCGLTIMATRQAGEPYYLHSYACYYNRVSEGLLIPFTLVTLMGRRGDRVAPSALEGIVAGALLVLIFFTKFTYGLVGIAIIAIALLTKRLRVRDLFVILAGVALSGLILASLTGISLVDWWADVGRPIRIGYSGSITPRRIVGGIVKGLPSLFALGIISGLAFNYLTRNERQRLAFAVIGFWGLSVLCTLASLQRQEYILPISIALILTDALFRRGTRGSRRQRIALTLLVLLLLPQLVPDARSLVLTWRTARAPISGELQIKAAGLSDLRLGTNQVSFAAELNDGLALAAESPTNAPLLAVDYSDVLAFALRRPPPEGGVVFWYPEFSFAPKDHPDFEMVFRGAPWLLIAREGREQHLFWKIYGDQVKPKYQLRASSQFFDLWSPVATP